MEHLQFLRASQVTRMPTPFELAQRYSLGFRECVQEVNRCLEGIPGGTPELKHRVLNHLSGCMAPMATSNSILAAQNFQTTNQRTVHTFPPNQRQDYNHNLLNNQRTPVCQISPPNRTVIHVPKPIKLEPPPFGNLLSSNVTSVRRLSSESCHTSDLKQIETIRPSSDLGESPDYSQFPKDRRFHLFSNVTMVSTYHPHLH